MAFFIVVHVHSTCLPEALSSFLSLFHLSFIASACTIPPVVRFCHSLEQCIVRAYHTVKRGSTETRTTVSAYNCIVLHLANGKDESEKNLLLLPRYRSRQRNGARYFFFVAVVVVVGRGYCGCLQQQQKPEQILLTVVFITLGDLHTCHHIGMYIHWHQNQSSVAKHIMRWHQLLLLLPFTSYRPHVNIDAR